VGGAPGGDKRKEERAALNGETFFGKNKGKGLSEGARTSKELKAKDRKRGKGA